MKPWQVVCSSPVSLLSKKQTKQTQRILTASVSSADLAWRAVPSLLTVTCDERIVQYREILEIAALHNEGIGLVNLLQLVEEGRGGR
jgi:hypothetical protein